MDFDFLWINYFQIIIVLSHIKQFACKSMDFSFTTRQDHLQKSHNTETFDTHFSDSIDLNVNNNLTVLSENLNVTIFNTSNGTSENLTFSNNFTTEFNDTSNNSMVSNLPLLLSPVPLPTIFAKQTKRLEKTTGITDSERTIMSRTEKDVSLNVTNNNGMTNNIPNTSPSNNSDLRATNFALTTERVITENHQTVNGTSVSDVYLQVFTAITDMPHNMTSTAKIKSTEEGNIMATKEPVMRYSTQSRLSNATSLQMEKKLPSILKTTHIWNQKIQTTNEIESSVSTKKNDIVTKDVTIKVGNNKHTTNRMTALLVPEKSSPQIMETTSLHNSNQPPNDQRNSTESGVRTDNLTKFNIGGIENNLPNKIHRLGDKEDDRFWPLAVALTIAIPTIIIIGVTISVMHRKSKLDKALQAFYGGYITPPMEIDV